MHENKPVTASVFSIRITASKSFSQINGPAYVREEYTLSGSNVPGAWAGNQYLAPTLLFSSKADLIDNLK